MASKKAGTAGAAVASSGPSLLKLTINCGQASPSPPVGPALGQKGVKAMDFCKQFNDQSKAKYLPNVPLQCQISVKSDRTFTFIIKSPTSSWLVKKAAGIEKGSSSSTLAYMSPKIFYEIAKIKHSDPNLQKYSLKSVYSQIVSQADKYGIKLLTKNIE